MTFSKLNFVIFEAARVQEFLRCAMDQLHRELCEPVLEEEEEQIIKSEEGGGHIESMSEVDSASSATGSEVGAAGWFTTGKERFTESCLFF